MSADTFKRLAALGLTIEQIGSVLEIMDEQKARFEAAEEARKSVARERVQRWRDKQKHDVTLQKRDGNATVRLTRVEDSSSKLDISGKKEVSASPSAPKRASRLPADWSLPDEWLAEAIKAGMSRDRALSEAERMKNWSLSAKAGSKLDWLATWRNWYRDKLDQPLPRSQAPPKPKTIGDIFRDDAKRMGLIPDDQPPDHETGRMAASNGSGEGGSPGIARRFAVSGDILGSIGPGSVLRRA